MSKKSPLLTPERFKIIKKSDSKKRVIEILAELLATKQTEKNIIFDALIAREKLGNTVLANGIAIPRARLDVNEPRAALVFLKKGIKLNSPDRKPTQIFLALLIPEKDSSNPGEEGTEGTEEAQKFSNMIKQLIMESARHPIIDDFKKSKNPQILLNYFNRLLKLESQPSKVS